MPRKPRRDTWRQVDGKWVRSLGSRGARIRLFEMTKGIYYRDVWVAGCGKNRKSLGTSDRAEADRLGTQLLAALLRQEDVIENGALCLKYLWEHYSKESPDFLDNTPRTRKEDEAHVRVLMDYFGEGADVRNFTEADVRAFTAKRLAGGILLESGEESTAVRARTPEIELRILKTMLRWATTIRTRGGQRLLAANPLAGIRGDREANPKRPVASWERFTAIRNAMQELAAKSGNQRWIRMEFALVLSDDAPSHWLDSSARVDGLRHGNVDSLVAGRDGQEAQAVARTDAAHTVRGDKTVPAPAGWCVRWPGVSFIYRSGSTARA
jgi:hypothetical protein